MTKSMAQIAYEEYLHDYGKEQEDREKHKENQWRILSPENKKVWARVAHKISCVAVEEYQQAVASHKKAKK